MTASKTKSNRIRGQGKGKERFVVDYHSFTSIETTKEKRSRLGVGDIYINAAVCNECKEYIRSRNRHDMVTCKCGNISVDGGSFYARRAFKTGTSWEDKIVLYNDVERTNEYA